MKWQKLGNSHENIRSILTNSFSKILPRIETIYTSNIGYSGIILTNDEKLTGKTIENSCYKKGGFYFLYKSYDDFELNNEFKELNEMITKVSYLYAEEIKKDFKSITLDSCWAVCQKEGDYGTIHNHKSPRNHNGELYSGMIYLKTPSSINPSSFPDGCLHLLGEEEIIYYPPIESSVILWPAKVFHGIHPFRGSGKRLGIAFNVIID